MKRKLLVPILIVEAALCLLLYFIIGILPTALTTIFAFPFEQIGLMLRFLSLSGPIGNVLSLMMYVLICLSPVILYIHLQRKNKVFSEDLLLLILSIILFVMMYFMINPGLMGSVFPVNMPSEYGRATFSLTFYVLLMGYGVLRILRQFYETALPKITQHLSILLSFLSGYYVLYIFGVIFDRYMQARDTLHADNMGLGIGLSTSETFLFMQYVVMALPYFLNIIVVLAIIAFLEEMGKDRYSDEAQLKAEHLTKLCRKTLSVIVLTSMGFHLFQFMFLKSISVVNTTLEIPFMPLIFILSVLMVTQFVRENKTLKQDNDLFI